MSDIIAQLSSQLGIKPDAAAAGAGSIFNVIKQQAPAGDFQSLLKAVPGASDWMSQATSALGGSMPPVESGTGGLLGKAAGMLGGLGGAMKGATAIASVVGLLGKFGIDAGTAAKFVPMLLQMVQSKAGPELMTRLAGAVPLLKDVAGAGDGGSNPLKGLFG